LPSDRFWKCILLMPIRLGHLSAVIGRCRGAVLTFERGGLENLWRRPSQYRPVPGSHSPSTVPGPRASFRPSYPFGSRRVWVQIWGWSSPRQWRGMVLSPLILARSSHTTGLGLPILSGIAPNLRSHADQARDHLMLWSSQYLPSIGGELRSFDARSHRTGLLRPY
jgi:hypothetical protein